MPIIRDFLQKDTEAVMRIWRQGNLDAHAFLSPLYFLHCYESVRRDLKTAEVYVLEENGAVIGFAGLSGDRIEGIFIERRYRGMGYGRDLLARCKNARSRLQLYVYKENERAIAFYRREGFEEISERICPRTGQPELLMEWMAADQNDDVIPAYQ